MYPYHYSKEGAEQDLINLERIAPVQWILNPETMLAYLIGMTFQEREGFCLSKLNI